ncbi:MAG: L,D-transpeptidase [Roseiflexaceae bacterium]|nr:L,D-transpeptidase [Roseiflexaceae bacterium]
MYVPPRTLLLLAPALLIALALAWPLIRPSSAPPARAAELSTPTAQAGNQAVIDASSKTNFTPRLSQAQAQQAVEKAQQADTRRRVRLDPTPAEGLPSVRAIYMAQSQHHLSDRVGFLSFWRANGGLLLFGYPISEELVEQGTVVQYFERAKFEYDPLAFGSTGQVKLALLGRELTSGRVFEPGAPGAGEIFFGETSHNLSGKFRQFWEKRGGLPIFGYPLSEPFEETSTIDGQVRIVQYFERFKFEYFPEELNSFYHGQVNAYGLRLAALREVQMADLGRQAAQASGVRLTNVQRLGGAADWAHENYARRIEVNLSTQQLVAYEDDVSVFQAPIATGRDGFNTPTGNYAIYDKYTMQDMVGAIGGESWYVPSVPWVQYVVGGVALHGTYWHDQWGTGVRMSHGCINLNIDDAQWLWEWADVGTTVNISY